MHVPKNDFPNFAMCFAGEALRMEMTLSSEDIIEGFVEIPLCLAPQTWPEGEKYDFPSYCGIEDSQFAALTVTDISIPDTGLAWTTRTGWFKDHSKWAVPVSEASQVQLKLQKQDLQTVLTKARMTSSNVADCSLLPPSAIEDV